MVWGCVLGLKFNAHTKKLDEVLKWKGWDGKISPEKTKS
jgi:hypothetical protein